MKPVKRLVTPRFRADRGAWEVDYRDLSGKRHRPLFADEAKALEFATNLVRQLESGVVPNDDPNMTLAQAFERYYETKARKKSLAKDREHAAHLLAAFGKTTRLRALTAGKIAQWRDNRLAAKSKRGGPLAAASINRPLSILRCLLKLAHEEWGVLPAVPKIRLLREPEGRIRWLEPDEEARLLAACETSRNQHLRNLVIVAMETGLRRGELFGLIWERVDLSRGVIRLEVTKAGKRREVPMRQVVYDTLASLPGPRTGRVWAASRIRTAWERAIEDAGIQDFTWHDLRHHFASWFMMRGGSLQALKEILGHADVKMTLRYAHLSPAYLRDEIAKTERPAGGQLMEPGTRNVEPKRLNPRQVAEEPVLP